jgi:hypothetical protein
MMMVSEWPLHYLINLLTVDSSYDGRRYVRSLIGYDNLQDPIHVNLNNNFYLRNSLRCGRDGSKFEFAKEVVLES